MTLADTALAVAALKALGKVVAERGDEAKSCLLEDMADAGAATVHAVIDGTRVGTVSFVAPEPKPFVAHSDILTAWLAVNNPDALEAVEVPAHTETRVRPEFMSSLTIKGHLAVTPDGEVVPGVETACTKPYLAVKSLKANAIMCAIRAGLLDVDSMLALPEGSEQ